MFNSVINWSLLVAVAGFILFLAALVFKHWWREFKPHPFQIAKKKYNQFVRESDGSIKLEPSEGRIIPFYGLFVKFVEVDTGNHSYTWPIILYTQDGVSLTVKCTVSGTFDCTNFAAALDNLDLNGNEEVIGADHLIDLFKNKMGPEVEAALTDVVAEKPSVEEVRVKLHEIREAAFQHIKKEEDTEDVPAGPEQKTTWLRVWTRGIMITDLELSDVVGDQEVERAKEKARQAKAEMDSLRTRADGTAEAIKAGADKSGVDSKLFLTALLAQEGKATINHHVIDQKEGTSSVLPILQLGGQPSQSQPEEDKKRKKR